MDLKVGLPVQIEEFLNVQFKCFQGANHVLHEFNLANMPFMNSYDWISLFYIVAKNVKKYETIYEHLKRMINCYILEIAKMDVEIASVLKKRPILKSFNQSENIQHLKGCLIGEKHWIIIYTMK
ncbi:unnamed protein product [Lactuca saligna]|uniref:Uncharacterized protein n=1 Tax=Lactuca saligna TaxID=75948 RepID=A0AA36E2R9_LACSI|nr:unnamed protein product [Lactuca saligna]